jgi:hypothetical protein
MTHAFRQSAADRIAELENEVDWLRQQLGTRDEQRRDIAAALDIPPQMAQIVAILYARAGHFVLADWIDDVLPLIFTERRVRKNLHVYVSKLRRVLGRDGIETRGAGAAYALRVTEVGAARIREALG